MIKTKFIAAAVAAGAVGAAGASIALAAPAVAAPNCSDVVDSINTDPAFSPSTTEKWTCASQIQANKWATFLPNTVDKWTSFPGDTVEKWTSFPGDTVEKWTSFPGDTAKKWTRLPGRHRQEVDGLPGRRRQEVVRLPGLADLGNQQPRRLTSTAFRPGPLRWIYLTLGLLMAATLADMYVPFFGQRLAHLVPVAAGFLGVALSVGWTLSEITSASVTRPRVVKAIVMVAPLVMATGLTLAAVSQFSAASVGVIAIWVVALVITGTGVGMAWPHLSAWAMGCVDDPREGARAAAAINTVQLICGAFGAGLAGIVVNLTDRGDAAAARWMFAVFAVLAVVGCVASYRASRAG